MYPFSLQAIHFSLDSLFLQPSRCVSVARGLWKEEEIWDLNNYIRTWSCSNWKRPVGREMDSLQPEIAVSVFCAWVRIWKGYPTIEDVHLYYFFIFATYCDTRFHKGVVRAICWIWMFTKKYTGESKYEFLMRAILKKEFSAW